ncbi:hypothetical protein [Rhodococcus wratislaviensis]|uniref:hypothetical protein n=1 Tax=Rhodococcus wratislaviensis TaxID=44752 RepID=UPI0036540B8D
MSNGEAVQQNTDGDVEPGGRDGRILAPPPTIPGAPPAATGVEPDLRTRRPE